MKVYKTQQEVDKDIKDGVLLIYGDVKFECPISVLASIKVIDGDINALDINAGDIDALNINAFNITAESITALDIKYHAFCNVYQSIICTSIESKRVVHSKPICLEGKLEIKPAVEQQTNPPEITIKGAKYRLVNND